MCRYYTHTEKIEMPLREKVYKILSYLISTFLSFSKKIYIAWNCSIHGVAQGSIYVLKNEMLVEYVVEKKSCSDCTVLFTELTKPFFPKHNIC